MKLLIKKKKKKQSRLIYICGVSPGTLHMLINSHHNPVKQAQLSSPFDRWGNWDPQRGSVPSLHRWDFWTWAVWLQNPCPSPLSDYGPGVWQADSEYSWPSSQPTPTPATSTHRHLSVSWVEDKGDAMSTHGRSEKESTCQSRDRFHPCVGKIPWRRTRQPTPVLPGKSHRQRSLAGYSPWSCRVGHNLETHHPPHQCIED